MKSNHTNRVTKWMTRTAVLVMALFVVSLASAQTAAPSVVLAPSASADVNETFVPGVAPFVILMKATDSQTTNYRFTVVATMVDGSTKTISGQAVRSDNNAGYTAATVALGGEAVSVSATVIEAN